MPDEDEDKKEEDNKEDDGAGGEVGEGEEGEDDEGEEGGGRKKLILLIGVALLLLVGIGAGLYFSGMLDGLLGKGGGEVMLDEHGEPVLDEHGQPVMVKKEKKDKGHGGGGHGDEGGAAFLEIPTMIVNLSSSDGSPRYLRLSVQLELNNQEDLAAVEAVIPRVVDQFQTYLRELRVKDLRGSAGLYRLQMELLWRVNQAAAPIEVKDVLFQEILIQ